MEINTLDDFIEIMPENIGTIMEKARCLYLELGKRSFYDTEYKYLVFGEEEQYSCYSSRIYKNPNIIICTTLAKQYVELLTKAGIEAELVNQDGHYVVRFYDESGKGHLVDITNDLKNIQFGCRTAYFSTETVEQNKIREIDIKLGYISEKRSYTDDYWYIVRESVQNSGLSQRKSLEIVLDNLQNYGDVTKPGDTEIFSIYQKFVGYCLPNSSNIMFYSTKPNRYAKEKWIVQIREVEQITQYILDSSTRLFKREIQQDRGNPTLGKNEKEEK